MTATITPPLNVKTARRDPLVRLADYAAALKFYLGLIGKGIDRIVFVENSESDVCMLREIGAGLPCDFLVFDGLQYPAEYGYGYGEFKLLQYAMDHMQVPEHARIVKVTGRYIIRNLPKLLAATPHVDLSCDIRNRRDPWVDMRIMIWTKRGFDLILRDTYLLLRDDINRIPPEMVLSRHILAHDSCDISTKFPIEPYVQGQRGFDGKDWARGSLLLKYAVRAAMRSFQRPLR